MLKAFNNATEADSGCTLPYSDILTQEILNQGTSLRVKGCGYSMHPFIRTGDTLLIEPKGRHKLSIGDIIFYRRPGGQYIAHRLVRKLDQDTLIAKGDNLTYYDDPVLVEQVFGRVVSIERDCHNRNLDSWLNKLIGRCWARFSPMSKWLYPLFRPGWKLYRKLSRTRTA